MIGKEKEWRRVRESRKWAMQQQGRWRPLTSAIIYLVQRRRIWFCRYCVSAGVGLRIVCLCGCRHVSSCIHIHLCVCVESPFRQLFGLAGGALSQSLIYSGPFEIIELTHLSDGERRNAKRSPGEVPAAPAPNLSCLQIAQSLHHNRWDSCLSFLPHPHTRTRTWACTQQRSHKCGKHPSHLSTRTHRGAVTPDTCHRRDSQAETCTVHICRHRHTNTPIYSLPLSLSLLLLPAHSVLFFLSRSDFHVQGQYEPSTGNITLSYPEHDKRTNTVIQRTKGGGDIVCAVWLFVSHSTTFILSLSYCLMISVSEAE